MSPVFALWVACAPFTEREPGAAAGSPLTWWRWVIIGLFLDSLDRGGTKAGQDQASPESPEAGCELLGGHGVMDSYNLLTRQPGRSSAVEPQALTSTCSRQLPPRLRESSLVSTAACGPGCSQGQRGLVTCCWAFMLWMATQTGLANGGGLSHTHFSGRGLCARVCRLCTWTPTRAPHFHRAWLHACIHAYFQTCAHLHAQANDRCHMCSENRSTQGRKYTQTHACTEQACKLEYLEFM